MPNRKKRRLSSRPTISRIVRTMGNQFDITTGSKNRFYFEHGAYYESDIVLRSKQTAKIEALIEAEQGTRKHVVGGIITADHCMGLQNETPVFIVVALTAQDLKDYRRRLDFIKFYVKNLKNVEVYNESEAIQRLESLKKNACFRRVGKSPFV
jgi:hypothetical protein